jgi:hypothetical protein
MSRKRMNPIVRSVTDRLWERDRLQMRAVDSLLSMIEPKDRHPRRPGSGRKVTRTR